MPRNGGSFPDRLSIDSVPASWREETQQIATPAPEITQVDPAILQKIIPYTRRFEWSISFTILLVS